MLDRPKTLVVSLLERLFRVTKLDAMYADVSWEGAGHFFDVARKAFDFRLAIDPSGRDRIPAHGPVIVVSNHPTGGMDSIVLMCLLLSIRSDVRLLAHEWFKRWPEASEHMLFVDPGGGEKKREMNQASTLASVEWLQAGGMVVTNPAGAVAYLHRRPLEVRDPTWRTGVAQLARTTKAPILPIFFDGRNSLAFQLVALLHPGLRRLLLAHELINKRGKTLHLNVGRMIPFDQLAEIGSDAELTEHLRAVTHQLSEGA